MFFDGVVGEISLVSLVLVCAYALFSTILLLVYNKWWEKTRHFRSRPRWQRWFLYSGVPTLHAWCWVFKGIEWVSQTQQRLRSRFKAHFLIVSI
jgi:hypothetical protein